MYPDGGIARLRVHGEPVPDPRVLATADLDLAALANGGCISDCSNMFYSSPSNLIAPGNARLMGEGWETARRRDGANDWVEVKLAGSGVIRNAEIDTSYFLGNAPGWAALSGWDSGREGPRVELIPKTSLQPDTVHVLRVNPHEPVTHVRLDVFPDGGLARLRLRGALAAAAREQVALRWFNLLPTREAIAVLGDYPTSVFDLDKARQLVRARPLISLDKLPESLRAEFRCTSI